MVTHGQINNKVILIIEETSQKYVCDGDIYM